MCASSLFPSYMSLASKSSNRIKLIELSSIRIEIMCFYFSLLLQSCRLFLIVHLSLLFLLPNLFLLLLFFPILVSSPLLLLYYYNYYRLFEQNDDDDDDGDGEGTKQISLFFPAYKQTHAQHKYQQTAATAATTIPTHIYSYFCDFCSFHPGRHD
jgi:hypothetical protein